MSLIPEKAQKGLSLEQIQHAYAEGIKESIEGMKVKTQDGIFRQFLTNSHNPHADSSKVTFSMLQHTHLISTTRTPSSITPAPPDK